MTDLEMLQVIEKRVECNERNPRQMLVKVAGRRRRSSTRQA